MPTCLVPMARRIPLSVIHDTYISAHAVLSDPAGVSSDRRLWRSPSVAFQIFDPVGPRICHEAQSLHLRYGLANRRQHVAGEGYLSGRKRQAAPVHNTQRMPSRQSRFEAQGLPRLSRRRLGSGNSGSISNHCASVNSSNRRLLTQPVSQTQTCIKKYLP